MNRVKALGVLITLILVCCSYLGFAQGGTSNQGKEFWTAYMSHIDAVGQASQMSLYVTGDEDTKVTVEIADGSFPAATYDVVAKQVTVIPIPKSAFLKNQGRFLKGLHIVAEKKIAVYAHIYASSVSGATLLLPVNVLGKSYYSINYTQDSNAPANTPAYSTFMVIATEDNTTVEITPSQLLLDGSAAGTMFSLTLQKGEVYQGLSANDLTNTKIRSVSSANGSCKRIAVFSGSSKIGIGCHDDQFTSDNLIQQAYPTAAWGKNFITVPLKNRNYDIYRVFFSDPNTVLTINGQTIDKNSYQASYYYQFSANVTNNIVADKPIQVVQYAVSQGKILGNGCQFDGADMGDPEMIYLNPLEQTLDHVTLYSSPFFAIQKHYINVVIKADKASTFMLDGAPYTNFIPVPGNPAYASAQISVSQGTHYINAADGFTAIAYGFGANESYGYSAGTNLKNLNEFIAFSDLNGSDSKLNGCVNTDYKLQLFLPYETTEIKWEFNDGVVRPVVHNPVATPVIKNGVQLYRYEYSNPVSFPKGDYTITATVINPLADECGVNVDIDFDFNIAEFPVSSFTYDGTCSRVPIVFHDTSDPKGSVIKTWLWDFGDDQPPSTEQNPSHTFYAAQDYVVKLTVTNENGCSEVSTQTIHIPPLPEAKFNFTNIGCLGTPVKMIDQSTIAEGTIVEWKWDYGDGTIETYTTSQAVEHLYASLGGYVVKLTVTSDKGCTDEFENGISVNKLPEVDFSLPDACVEDFVQFTDKSTIGNGDEQYFHYSWNFGDTHLVPGQLNTSTEKDPKHKYSQAGVYSVTLTVTAGNGCPQTFQQNFTVNGSVPKAVFIVENSGNLCSANDVVVQDQSTVDFGSITKIKIWYDFANHPELSEEILKADLPADRRYHHIYDLSTANAGYTIHMEAYSGESCSDVTDRVITVKGNPTVAINAVAPLCQEDAPIQLVADNHGFLANSFYYSGTGVNNGGTFDPSVSGAGTFTITYHFIAQNGCDAVATTDITVNPSPTVNAGNDLILLEGESVVLPATASGNGLIYEWSPAIGLNNKNALNPVSSAIDDTPYTLTVTTAEGCTASDEIMVTVLKKPVIVNAFTPNGDGINDTWKIKYLETYPGNTVDIYNRQGEKVYSSVGYASAWDGRYKGNVLPTGTYYYIINPKNGRKVISGNVTIIK